MTNYLMPADGIRWDPFPTWVVPHLRESGADPVDKAAYLEIWDARDPVTGVARIGRPQLAERLRAGEGTVRRAIRRLEAWGLIRREDKATGGRGVWAGYYVALDGPNVFPFRVNRYASVDTVRGPRPATTKPVHGRPAKPVHARPLVPSVLPAEPVDNLTENPSTTDRVLPETRPPQTGFRAETRPPQTGSIHREKRREAAADRARAGEGGGTAAPNAAAAEGNRTEKPVASVPALAELRALVGADGILPTGPEAERLVARYRDAGGDLAELAVMLCRRVTRADLTNTPGYVLTILRDLPPVVARPDVAKPAWCGECVVPGRWVPDEYGLPSTTHCPACSSSADKRADAKKLPLGSSEKPVDRLGGIFGELLRGEPSEDALDVIAGRTRDLAATGTEG